MAHNKVFGICESKCKVEVPTKKEFNEVLPIGLIFPFMGATAPENYFICDGSTFDEEVYVELYELLGTNILPDLRDKFLQGANNNLGTNIEAGLPNITGKFMLGGTEKCNLAEGAFKNIGTGGNYSSGHVSSEDNPIMLFDASRCSAVYGNSDTVQPNSYTVNYIIKAK